MTHAHATVGLAVTEGGDERSVEFDRDNRGDRDTAASNAASDTGYREAARGNRVKIEPHAHFRLVEEDTNYAPGVYWVDVVTDKESEALVEGAPQWVCSPLRIAAMTRDAQGSAWGRLLEFPDRDGRVHRWSMPMSLLAGNGDEIRAALLAEGLTISTAPALRRKVLDYIQSECPKVKARSVVRTGWHGDAFVLPRQTFGGSEDEPVFFQSPSMDGVALGQAGTLDGWREQVAARCAGNSRLVLAVSAGFAAPCLDLLQLEGGGIHLRGASSTGKSTALAVGASMYGPPGYVRSWRATDNALEGVAALHSDLLLVLDEIGQLDTKLAGQVAYLLANGQGKGRCHQDGSARARATWRLLFLSAGETSLSDLVAQSGGRTRAGQEVRVIDLPSDAGQGHGLFETLPVDVPAGAFADALRDASSRHHGHALPAFLEQLVANPEKARGALRALRDQLVIDLTPANADGQVRRVAGRFALVAAAGELATLYGLTGWQSGEAEEAATRCFKAWLDHRGTIGAAEPEAMLEQVRAFLVAHGESRFAPWGAIEEQHIPNRAGYRKRGPDGDTYFVEREVFRHEICAGFDCREVARVLVGMGALEPESHGDKTRMERLPDGRKARVYRITPALWAST